MLFNFNLKVPLHCHILFITRQHGDIILFVVGLHVALRTTTWQIQQKKHEYFLTYFIEYIIGV